MENCTLETFKQMLSRPIWSNKDIMAYVGCSKTTASNIRQQALKRGGVVRGCPSKTKRNAILEVLGIDYDDEVKKIKKLEEGGKQ